YYQHEVNGVNGVTMEKLKNSVAASCVELKMERETGIEPATNSLEGCDSTIELLPRFFEINHLQALISDVGSNGSIPQFIVPKQPPAYSLLVFVSPAMFWCRRSH